MTYISEIRELIGNLTALIDRLAYEKTGHDGALIDRLMPQYESLVAELNSRLAECEALLNRGLRDEAVMRAEEEPNLLEAVGFADLSSRPQWPKWTEILQANGVQLPPLPNTSIAAEIDEAIVKLDELKPLLDQWRRAMLTNSPIRKRLSVLRRIYRSDQNNIAWIDTIRDHEKQRLMDIDGELRIAFQKADEQGLVAIRQELKENWLTRPSNRILRSTDRALHLIRARRVNKQLKVVAADLCDCFQRKDLQKARTLQDEWNLLEKMIGTFSSNDPIIESVHEVFQWIEAHNELDHRCEALWEQLNNMPKSYRKRREWMRDLKERRDEVQDLLSGLGISPNQTVTDLSSQVDSIVSEESSTENQKKRFAFGIFSLSTASFVLITASTFAAQSSEIPWQVADEQTEQSYETCRGEDDRSLSNNH